MPGQIGPDAEVILAHANLHAVACTLLGSLDDLLLRYAVAIGTEGDEARLRADLDARMAAALSVTAG